MCHHTSKRFSSFQQRDNNSTTNNKLMTYAYWSNRVMSLHHYMKMTRQCPRWGRSFRRVFVVFFLVFLIVVPLFNSLNIALIIAVEQVFYSYGKKEIFCGFLRLPKRTPRRRWPHLDISLLYKRPYVSLFPLSRHAVSLISCSHSIESNKRLQHHPIKLLH